MKDNTVLVYNSSTNTEMSIVDWAGEDASEFADTGQAEGFRKWGAGFREFCEDNIHAPGLYVIEWDNPSDSNLTDDDQRPDMGVRDLTQDEWTRFRNQLSIVA